MAKPSLPPALADLANKADELRASLQRVRFALDPVAQRRAKELGKSLAVESAATFRQVVAFARARDSAGVRMTTVGVLTIGNAMCLLRLHAEKGSGGGYSFQSDDGSTVHTTVGDALFVAAHRAAVCLETDFRDALRAAAMPTPRPTVRRVPPIWKRLKVAESDELVTLDGKPYRVTDAQGKFLRVLWVRSQQKDRQDVKGSEFGDLISRPDRVWARLPEPLRAVVSKPGRGRIGWRLMAGECR